MRSSFCSLAHKDLLGLDIGICSRFKIGGKKLRMKQDVIDKWKERYDQDHKFIKTL